MAKSIAPLLPTTVQLLERLGERLRLARRRRRLAAKQVAERAGMTAMTLRSLERGGSGVTIGAYLAVMQVLGVEKDVDLLCATDSMGRELQDARLFSPEKPTLNEPTSAEKRMKHVSSKATRSTAQRGKITGTWVEKTGFISAQSLSALLDTHGTLPKRRR